MLDFAVALVSSLGKRVPPGAHCPMWPGQMRCRPAVSDRICDYLGGDPSAAPPSLCGSMPLEQQQGQAQLSEW